MATDRKTVPLKNKHGKRVNITFPNCTLDLLGKNMPNVTEGMQFVFAEIEEQFPLLAGRALVERVRGVAYEKARETLTREELM